MTDDRELRDLDPYDLMAEEAGRIHAHLATLDAAGFAAPSRCAGWDVRAVLAHLAASESYNRACLEGTVARFLQEMAGAGVTDLASANEVGIHRYDGVPVAEILESWRAEQAANREALRARDGGDLATSVGSYPVRLQAFHLAFELAVHADDIAVPVPPARRAGRLEWEARVARFVLAEVKPSLSISAHDGSTRVSDGNVDVEMPNDVFVATVAARLPDTADVPAEIAGELSVTP